MNQYGHRNRLAKLLGLPALVVISGCVAGEGMNNLRNSDATTVDPSQFEAQLKCVQEWRALLEEWERNNSDAGKDLVVVRSKIERDKNTRFALFVREVWSQQSVGDRSFNEGWKWPVSDSVKSSVRSALLVAEPKVVSTECAGTAIFLLPQLLGEEVVSERSSSPLREIETDAVDATRSDSTEIGQWLFYSLLAR